MLFNIASVCARFTELFLNTYASVLLANDQVPSRVTSNWNAGFSFGIAIKPMYFATPSSPRLTWFELPTLPPSISQFHLPTKCFAVNVSTEVCGCEVVVLVPDCVKR